MPPLPSPGNVVKVLTQGKLYDAEWLNIWYVGWSGATPDSGTLESYLTTAWKPEWDTIFGAQASTESTTDLYTAIDLSSDTGAEASASDSQEGSRTGDVAPGSACVVASLEINRRYRGGHPRKYLPFGTAGTYASASSKFWDSGFIDSVQTDLAAFISAVGGRTEGSTNFTEVVSVSYYTGGALRVTPVVDAVTSVAVRTRICSQRRRLGKVDG